MLKAVIFDMDGVLIDSEHFYMKRRQNFFKEYGLDLDDETAKGLVGLNPRDLIADRFPNKDREQTLVEYETYKQGHPANFMEMIDDDANQILPWLKEKNLKVAVASSSSIEIIKQVVNNAGWSEYFDLLVSGDEFPQSKPDPTIYFETVARLGVAPEEVLVIEDSTYGITAAKTAGLKVIAKEDERLPMDQSQADMKITRLTEIIDIIETKGKIS